MRITNLMSMYRMLGNINKNATRVDLLYQQMASGKKIQNPSDNPIIASRALKFRTSLSTTEQHIRNAAQASSWLNISESGFSNTLSIMERMRELMVYGSTDTLSVSDREKIITEIITLAEQIGNEMNVSYSGRYVFSGYYTDQPPILSSDRLRTSFDIFQKFDLDDIFKTVAYTKEGLLAEPSLWDIIKIDLPYKGSLANYPISFESIINSAYGTGLSAYNVIYDLMDSLSYETVYPVTPAIIDATEPSMPATVMNGINPSLEYNVSANLMEMAEMGADGTYGFPREGAFAIQVYIPPSAGGLGNHSIVLDFGAMNPDGNFTLEDFEQYFQKGLKDLAEDLYGVDTAIATFEVGDDYNIVLKAVDVNDGGVSLGGSGVQVKIGATTIPSGTGNFIYPNYLSGNSNYPDCPDAIQFPIGKYVNASIFGDSESSKNDVTSRTESPWSREELIALGATVNPDGTLSGTLNGLEENEEVWAAMENLRIDSYVQRNSSSERFNAYNFNGSDYASFAEFKDAVESSAATNKYYKNITVNANFYMDREGYICVNIVQGVTLESGYNSLAGYPSSSRYSGGHVSDPLPRVTSDYSAVIPERGKLEIKISNVPGPDTVSMEIDFSQNSQVASDGTVFFINTPDDLVAYINYELNYSAYHPTTPIVTPNYYDPEFPVAKAEINSSGKLVITASESYFSVEVSENQSTRPMFDKLITYTPAGRDSEYYFVIEGNPSANIPLTARTYDSIEDFVDENKEEFEKAGWLLEERDGSLYFSSIYPASSFSNPDTITHKVENVKIISESGVTDTSLMEALGLSGLDHTDGGGLKNGESLQEYNIYDLEDMENIANGLMRQMGSISDSIRRVLIQLEDARDKGTANLDQAIAELNDFHANFQNSMNSVKVKVDAALEAIERAYGTPESETSSDAEDAFNLLKEVFEEGGINGYWDSSGLEDLYRRVESSLGDMSEMIVDRVTLHTNLSYVPPNSVSDPKSVDYDPSHPDYNSTIDPNSPDYDNKSEANQKHSFTAINGDVVTKYAVTTMSENDIDFANRYNPGPNAIHFIPSTGELILGTNVAKELGDTGKSGMSLDYNVNNLYAGEPNPIAYFECKDLIDNRSYNAQDDAIKYEMGTGTSIQINNLASNSYTADVYAQIMNFTDMISRINVTSESDLRQYLSSDEGGNLTGDALEEAISERLTFEDKKYMQYVQSAFSAILGEIDVHQVAFVKEYAILGSRINRVELITNRLEQNRVTYTSLMSGNEDVDYTEIIMKMSDAEALYQASMLASTRIQKLVTLASFI